MFIAEIAEATCRELSTVRQWLSGVQVPNAKAKERISAILNVPVDELFPADEVGNVPSNEEPT